MIPDTISHKGTVRLETERLILRRFTMEDADAMYRNWASDPEVTRFLCWPAHTDVSVSRAVAKRWVVAQSQPDFYQWAIVLKAIGEPVGTISAVEQCDETSMVRIGYCIGRAWWKQGYTSEALKEVIRFFFEEVGINRIESMHDPRNVFSGRVMMKCGLRYEGTRRQGDFSNQGLVDGAVYALLAQDYAHQKTAGFHINIGNLAIDCQDPQVACSFYEALTGWRRIMMYDCPALIAENGLVILFMACDFQYQPPVWPEEESRQQKQKHLDFQVDHLPAAVERALQLGAICPESQYGGEQFVTLIDPEGQPFCLCRQ